LPEVSRFFGILILMYYNDHPPPHFHARYAGHKAVIGIDSLTLLEERLPPRALGLVMEWASQHQAELLEDWKRARMQEPLIPISPLE
jgi:hypothetical protein